MKLLEAATVITGVQLRDYENRESRECGMELLLTEACTQSPEEREIVGGDDSTSPGTYKAFSFPIQGFLRGGVLCQRPDDIDWFAAAFQNSLDMALGFALTVEYADGAQVWTNGPDVQSVALAATPTDAQLGAAVAAGYRQWYKSVVVAAGGPILHVPPSLAARLKFAGVLLDDNKSIYGTPVVINPGYDEHPNIFWTGPITIKVGVPITENVPLARLNSRTLITDQFAEFDIPPCSIVRVGTYA